MWTLQQFEEIFDRYQSSGLRIKEFCRNESIVESRFYYWQKRLQKHNYRTVRESGFVPIVFTGSNSLPANKAVHFSSFSSDPLKDLKLSYLLCRIYYNQCQCRYQSFYVL